MKALVKANNRLSFMGTIEEPVIQEYAEGNGKFTRQDSERYLLDTIVYLFNQGLKVKEVLDRKKLHPKLRIAISGVTEGFEQLDPSWLEILASGNKAESVEPEISQQKVAEYLKSFVIDFLYLTQTNRIPNLELVQHNYELWIEKRLKADFDLACVEIPKLMHWSSGVVLARQDLLEHHEIDSPEPTPVFPKPAPQPYGVSHYGAEVLARDWLRHIGHIDAQETQKSSDGGIDVYTGEIVVQVKNYKDYVGVPAVRELLGVAVSEGKRPVLFTSGSLTTDAAEFAEKNRIPVFKYSAEIGSLDCLNRSAREFLEESLQRLIPVQDFEVKEPFEEVLIPFYITGELIQTFMNSFYSMKLLFNYHNAHKDLFDSNSELVTELVAQIKDIELEMVRIQDVSVSEMAYFSEHMAEGDSSPGILASAQRAREINIELADLLNQGIELFLRTFSALGVPENTE